MAAFGQIFFSLSLGMAAGFTYASYTGDDIDLISAGLCVVIANSLFENIAALGVFSILGYMSFQSGRDKRKENKSSEWEKKKKKQEYWANVKYARKQLLDYYGTACHFFPAARGDLIRVKNMQPDEVLREARRNNLI